MSSRRNGQLIIIIIVSSLVGLMFLDPIAQPQSYHNFADQRSFLGVPNFLDLISNLPFAFVGILGLCYTLKKREGEANYSWLVFFVGVAIVSLGSAYYHLDPNDATLVWDRLPMTVGFIGLTIGLLTEHVNSKSQKWFLLPAVIAGAASVIYWHYTNDLRFYIWIQAAPLLAIVTILLVFKRRYTHQAYLSAALVCYLLAKLVELFDTELFALTFEQLSGHTLKHLLAALGTYSVYLMLSRRRLSLTP